MSPVARIATWNTEWAPPGSRRGGCVAAIIRQIECDVICVTEGFAEILPPRGHVIDSEADYGYVRKPGCRKVLLWSRQPWDEVDRVGHEALPGGRYVAGCTETPIGRLAVCGVCIPWRDAHVRTGRQDREPWEDHRRYLEVLPRVPHWSPEVPLVVAGDFNQRIPRRWVPEPIQRQLLDALGEMSVATSGELAGAPKPSIDHIAHGPELRCQRVKAWPAESDDGVRLSDHFGLWVELRRAKHATID